MAFDSGMGVSGFATGGAGCAFLSGGELLNIWRKMILTFSLLLILLTGCSTDGEKLADKMDLEGQSFCHVKEGHYCGEGMCEENHGTGYLYFTDELTQEEAMEQAGFQKTETDYSNGPEYAEIVEVRTYEDGYLLEYRITGSG